KAEVNFTGRFKVIGGGARVNWKGAGSLLVSSFPTETEGWSAHSKDHVHPDPSTITTFAIGMKSGFLKRMGLKRVLRSEYSSFGNNPSGECRVGKKAAAISAGIYAPVGSGSLMTGLAPISRRRWFGSSKAHINPYQTSFEIACIGLRTIQVKK
ncbi:MAG: hypothetical protein AAF203_06525, partial [Pseudomonadota bacterium]